MASNPYFNYFEQNQEQNLMESLVFESLRQKAHDVMYLPRDVDIKDEIMTEPVVQSFSKALPVEMYINNWDNFQGEGQLLSKFGLEIRDQMTLLLTKRAFKRFIQDTTKKDRPWEGDCIYIPMFNNIYQIKYVSSSNPAFYILGKNYVWELTCELLEFSNEQFRTGVSYIDELNPAFQHYNESDYDLESYDRTAQNSKIQEESDKIIDWTESSPFGET